MQATINTRGRPPRAWSTDVCDVLLKYICSGSQPRARVVEYLEHALVVDVVAPVTYLAAVSALDVEELVAHPARLAALVRLLSTALSSLAVDVDSLGLGDGNDESAERDGVVEMKTTVVSAVDEEAAALISGLSFAFHALGACLDAVLRNGSTSQLGLMAAAENAQSLVALVGEVLDDQLCFITLVVAVHDVPDDWRALVSAAQAVRLSLDAAEANGVSAPGDIRMALATVVARMESAEHPRRQAVKAAHGSFLIGPAALTTAPFDVSDAVQYRMEAMGHALVVVSDADMVRSFMVLAELSQLPLGEVVAQVVSGAYMSYQDVDVVDDVIAFASLPRLLALWQASADDPAAFADALCSAILHLWQASEKTPANVVCLPKFAQGLLASLPHHLQLSMAQAEEYTHAGLQIESEADKLGSVSRKLSKAAMPLPNTPVGILDGDDDFLNDLFAPSESESGAATPSLAAGGVRAKPAAPFVSEASRTVAYAIASGTALAPLAVINDPSVVATSSQVGPLFAHIRNPQTPLDEAVKLLTQLFSDKVRIEVAAAVAEHVVEMVSAMADSVDTLGRSDMALLYSLLGATDAVAIRLAQIGLGLQYGAALARLALALIALSGSVGHGLAAPAVLLFVSFYDKLELASYLSFDVFVQSTAAEIGEASAISADLRALVEAHQTVSAAAESEAAKTATQQMKVALFSTSNAQRVTGALQTLLEAMSPWAAGVATMAIVQNIAERLHGADVATAASQLATIIDVLVALGKLSPYAMIAPLWWLATLPDVALQDAVGKSAASLFESLPNLPGLRPVVARRMVATFRQPCSESSPLVAIVAAAGGRTVGGREGEADGAVVGVAASLRLAKWLRDHDMRAVRMVRQLALVTSTRHAVDAVIDAAVGPNSPALRLGASSQRPDFAAYVLHIALGVRGLGPLLTGTIPALVPKLTSRRQAIQLAHVVVRVLALAGDDAVPRRIIRQFFAFVTEFLEAMALAMRPAIAFPLGVLALIYQHRSLARVLQAAPATRLACALRCLRHDAMAVPLFRLDTTSGRERLVHLFATISDAPF
ncbi:uncharacterized protein AMSG_04081 [Thecamonas trahens ATCC 50062]|uniref:Uncharacterized protein n=1 Tax=Thecamonas trahens ATCC 50062 TaxID=461836 RepID=A0A0L0D6X4_THETB|nr:hypothetical protein AMSG_04081 [Thecamonas trahens ATCC 50062]KNC47851.1 hypothetical protein AMSG_04081 [Thecamonas trahens ATCC 50062]|eukprot:XP_013759329.1 hypothetical protein AMSG_04081 [Thecamonas trahens ATCC 50062]